jgi:phage head maturation protease
MNNGPRGWSPHVTEHRFSSNQPASYDPDQRTVDAVISVGAAVPRFYGTEILKISPEAVDLSRLTGAGIPCLDSHIQTGISSCIGQLQRCWFEPGQLLGTIGFNDTPGGRAAEKMTARGEIRGVSAGYKVLTWQVKDSDGNVVDTDKDRIRWDDDLTFTATRWQLLEASLVAVPADNGAAVRSLSSYSYIAALRNRMEARQRMSDRSFVSQFSNLRDAKARMAARARMIGLTDD